jgi:signal recognition particle receptor subunit beta
MGRLNRDTGEIQARIVYYGPSGAGKTANARFIHGKLKKEHRGDLRVAHARKERSGAYEFMPVQLGTVRGFQTSLHLHTVPGGDRYAEERQRMLEDVDGVVFVADLRPERHEATVASLEELEQNLQDYGRSLDDVLLVVQYNHRDEADESALEKLHARLGVKPEAYHEAIASQGTGVLQSLTTLSKAILSQIRREADEAEKGASAESTALSSGGAAPADSASGRSAGFRIESAGPPKSSGAELSIPLRLIDEGDGRAIELCVRVSIGG